MKPFDLEAAKRGEPICDSERGPLRFICFDEVSNKIVYGYEGKRIAYTDLMIAETCIFMAPKTRTVWVNLFDWDDAPDGPRPSEWHVSSESAEKFQRCNRIGGKAYPVEIEE